MDVYTEKKFKHTEQNKVISGQTDRERGGCGESESTRKREQTLRLRGEDQSIGQSSVDAQH